jgi:hypothetical protein
MPSFARLFAQTLLQWRIAAGVTIVVSLAATWAKIALGAEAMNNFLIFRASFQHLLRGNNLYAPHTADHFDLFKYSPAFAVMMAPFAALPLWAGALLWNLLNTALFLAGVWAAAKAHHWLDDSNEAHTTGEHARQNIQSRAALLVWITLFELLTALQNFQSNALLVGMFLLTVAAFQRQSALWAGLWIALAASIKVYGLAVLVLLPLASGGGLMQAFAFGGRVAGWTAIWSVALALLPLVTMIGAHAKTDLFTEAIATTIAKAIAEVSTHYAQWWDLLRSDHATSLGISVLSWIRWLPVAITSSNISQKTIATALQVASLLACAAPLLWRAWRAWSAWQAWKAKHILPVHRENQEEARSETQMRTSLLWLGSASVLVWMVIFNHKAESPTYIFAMTGVALWFVTERAMMRRAELLNEQNNELNTERNTNRLLVSGMLWCAIVFTSLSATDLFPPAWRDWFYAVSIKALPCLLVWVYLQIRLWRHHDLRSAPFAPSTTA